MPPRRWRPNEKVYMQDLLQMKTDKGNFWHKTNSARRTLARAMNKKFPPDVNRRSFIGHDVEKPLRLWMEAHPRPNVTENAEESDVESEKGSEGVGNAEDAEDAGDAEDGDGADEEQEDREGVEEEEAIGQDAGGRAAGGRNAGRQNAGDQDADAQDVSEGKVEEDKQKRRPGGKKAAADARSENKRIPKRERD